MYTFDTYWLGPPLMQNERKLLKSTLKQSKSVLEEQHLKELNTLSKRPPAEEFQHQGKNKRLKHSDALQMDTSMRVHSDEHSNRKDPSTVVRDLLFSNTQKPNLILTNTPSAAFLQWQQDHGIHASVYSAILTALLPIGDEANDAPFSPQLPNPLSYATVAVSPDETLNYSPDIGSNKEDILTQSQMLKTTDRDKFIECQHTEIAGLKKFDDMDIHPITELPA